MSKAEKFIQDYTRNCSNEYFIERLGSYISRRNFSPWLTPDDARRAVEIAREEMTERVCSFIADNIGEYLELKHTNPSTFIIIDGDRFINDLKQAMKNE